MLQHTEHDTIDLDQPISFELTDLGWFADDPVPFLPKSVPDSQNRALLVP